LKRWGWLWNEWLTSTDPKKIGIMYIVVASLMFFRGALDAAMIWLQQSLSSGNSHGYLDGESFPTNLYRPRRHHDFLCDHGIFVRVAQFDRPLCKLAPEIWLFLSSTPWVSGCM
jgi:heme/copper-type cytochrome/quinol oxidase subunit 1